MSIESLDLFVHANPALVAVVLYWLAEGHQNQRASDGILEERGLPLLWAIMAVALLLTEELRQSLPKNANARLSGLFAQHPSWRPRLAASVASWSGPVWRGIGYGTACGVLLLENGRIHAQGSVSSPVDDWVKETAGRSRTLGRVIAKEPGDGALRVILGLQRVTGGSR